MLTLSQRLILAAFIAAILIGPIAMLFLALAAHGHKPATPIPVRVTAPAVPVVSA